MTAYDPVSGGLAWQVKFPGWVQGGPVATSGGLVFVGDSSGVFHAFEAKSGRELWRFYTGSGIHSSAMVYQLNGEQFVSVGSGGRPIAGTPGGDLIVTFALPRP